jgi:hypothetical protein
LQKNYILRENDEPEVYDVTLGVGGKPTFYHSFSYHYNWVTYPENVLETFTPKKGMQLALHVEGIKVQREEDEIWIPLAEIRQLTCQFRYLILPLIIGGIVVPLALLAYFKGFVTFLPGFMFIFTGIMLFYFGLKGSYQVQVEQTSQVFAFFVDEQNKELQQFIDQCNFRIEKAKEKNKKNRENIFA